MSILNGKLFQNIKTFDEFKQECRMIWEGLRQVDTFANLYKYMTTPRDPDLFSLASNIAGNMAQVKEDLLASKEMEVHIASNGTPWVNLDHILSYVGMGVLYQDCNEEERRAMKKVRPSPKERLSKAAYKVYEEMERSNVRLEENVLVTQGYQKYKGNKKFSQTSEEKIEEHSTNKANKGTGAKPKQAEGKKSKGRCYNCGKPGHSKGTCNMEKKCSWCERRGHTLDECWWANKKKKKLTSPKTKDSTERTKTAKEVRSEGSNTQ